MAKRVLLAGAAFLVLGAANSFATSVALSVNVNTTTSTWTVTGTASDSSFLGLADFSLDVDGSGVSIIKAATAAQTNQTPVGVFSQLRTTGTVSGTNLTGIAGSQDIIDALNNNDDSGASGGTALVYGYMANTNVSGQFTSNNYGSPGTVTGLGPTILAMGRYTGSPTGGVSTITAVLTPSTQPYQFYPLNWDPNESPPLTDGGSQSVISASAVTSGVYTFQAIPEPASLLLLGLGGLGLAFAARRRRNAA